MVVVAPGIKLVIIDLEPKLSDVVETLPLDLFGADRTLNRSNGTMCGAGIIMALGGGTLSVTTRWWDESGKRIYMRLSALNFGFRQFDRIYWEKGVACARAYVVEWLDEQELMGKDIL